MVDPVILQRMCDVMRHRGPDSHGQYVAGRAGIASVRLAVIDLATGKQPMLSEDGNLSITYNGEVYNYKALRSRLANHAFITQSDTEVVLHAFEEWGLSSLSQLNGMFAFAVWDRSKGELILARDRVGIKPVYYTLSPDCFAFASEIKALVRSNVARVEVDVAALNAYLHLKYVPSAQTMFRGIFRLLPGQWLRVHANGKIGSGRFFEYSVSGSSSCTASADLVDELRSLVRSAVEDQMVADVPVGAFLSGGLDSSIVVTEMARIQSDRVKAFTVDYEGASGSMNEAEGARKVASSAQAEHYVVSLDTRVACELLPTLVYQLDEPIAEPLLASSYVLARAARRKATVVLTGEGADELFGGYTRYQIQYWINWLHMVPAFARQHAFQLAARLLGPLDVRTRVLGITLNPSTVDSWYAVFSPQEIARLTGKPYTTCEPDDFSRKIVDGWTVLDQLMDTDLRFRLPEYILTRADKMTMANSLEMRPPLLDNRIIEFAQSLPMDLKLHGRETKYLLRRAFEFDVPASVAQGKKVAFSAPYARWLPQLCREYLHDSHAAQSGLIVSSELQRIIRRDPLYRGRYHERLWALIIFEIWFRIYVDASLMPE